MLENLKELSGAKLREQIRKRLKVYTNTENILDSFLSSVGQLVTASAEDEETYDGLEETLQAFASDFEAIAAGRNEVDVTGDVSGKRANIIQDHSVELSKFSAPPRETLVKNHSYLKKAREYQEEMDYLITRLKESTDKDDKALLKTLSEHRKLMNAKKDKAQDVLESLAERHVPRELAKAAEALEDHVIKLLGSEEGIGAQWFITQESDNLDFTFFLHAPIKDHHKNHLDVYLALTGRVQETAKGYVMRVFITSMNKFKLPGHYELGERINFTSQQTMSNALKREANRLMAKQGLVAALSTNKLDVTTRQLRNAGINKLKHVIDLRVQGNAIYLLLSDVSDADIERQTVPDLIVLLKNVLHKQKSGAVLLRSIETTKSRKKMMKIISVNEV